MPHLKLHASEHTDGTDDIQSATNAQKGLATASHITAIESATAFEATKGQANGLCPLDGSSLVDASYLPSYVDDVLEYANLGAFPGTGETGKIYVALDTNLTYRWSGSVYVEIASGAFLPLAGGTMTGQILAPQSATIGYSFNGDTDTGLRSSSSDQAELVAGNTIVLSVSTSKVMGFLPFMSSADGTATNPRYTFNSDQNTGMYRIGADELGFSTNGALALSLGTSSARMFHNTQFPSGSVSLPGVTFNNDTDSGLYRIGADNFGFAVNGARVADVSTAGFTLATGARITEFSTDGTLAGDSDTAVPTEKAVKAYADGLPGGATISDAVYGAGWNGDTSDGASKNAIYDKVETLVDDTAYGAGWNGDVDTAPSKNAVYDKLETVVDGDKGTINESALGTTYQTLTTKTSGILMLSYSSTDGDALIKGSLIVDLSDDTFEGDYVFFHDNAGSAGSASASVYSDTATTGQIAGQLANGSSSSNLLFRRDSGNLQYSSNTANMEMKGSWVII